ncbi:hypothetical protein B7463_g2284, partial [Scytalidium lignicola]
MASNTSTTVLVTGGSGFVGGHRILQLLAAGYMVRTTVRNLSREEEVRKRLIDSGAKNVNRLSFYAAVLEKNAGWAGAIKGCTYVQHVASPLPLELPSDENELIVPAREGTLRVLRASRDAGVKRVVLTSSFAAIGYGHPQRKEPFTEKDWSIIDGTVTMTAYQKSKTIAETAAWDFMNTEGGSLELTVVNPVGILGPILSTNLAASIEMVKKVMDGSMPGCPQVYFGMVDVRDLSGLYIRAMTNPAAKNERFLAVNDRGPVSMLEMTNIIRENRPEKSQKVPTRELPNWFVRVVALFMPATRHILPQLGVAKKTDNTKSKTVLGWKPRPLEETIFDTVDSLVKFGVV